jgi:hypothetical protein
MEEEIFLSDSILSNSELKDFFEYWISYKSENYFPKSLLEKIFKLSLQPQTIIAGTLFFLYKNEKVITKELEKFLNSKNRDIFLEAISLYKKLKKVDQFNKVPKTPKQVELTLRMFFAVLEDVQLLTVLLVLKLHKLEEIETNSSN